MNTYKELEALGFFEWLYEEHGLSNDDITTECLDKLPLNAIYRTVVNAMAFRWFREKYNLVSYIRPMHKNVHNAVDFYITNIWHYNINGALHSIDGNGDNLSNSQEAELACLKKLIELAKQSNENE